MDSVDAGGISVQENAEKVLVALYIEANNKKPQPAHVNIRLDLAEEDFGRAVNLLYGAGMIGGVVIRFGEADDHPVQVIIEDLLLKRRGAKYVEKALNLAAEASLLSKLRKIIDTAREKGWKDIGVMAEEAYTVLSQG
jgi:hypothetical protein